MNASIKKSKPKSDKGATKQTNDNFFCQKSISDPNFTKSEGKVRFGHFFVENDTLDEQKRMPLSKKFCLFKKLVNLPLSY